MLAQRLRWSMGGLQILLNSNPLRLVGRELPAADAQLTPTTTNAPLRRPPPVPCRALAHPLMSPTDQPGAGPACSPA